jgi:hypothetical protein
MATTVLAPVKSQHLITMNVSVSVTCHSDFRLSEVSHNMSVSVTHRAVAGGDSSGHSGDDTQAHLSAMTHCLKLRNCYSRLSVGAHEKYMTYLLIAYCLLLIAYFLLLCASQQVTTVTNSSKESKSEQALLEQYKKHNKKKRQQRIMQRMIKKDVRADVRAVTASSQRF